MSKILIITLEYPPQIGGVASYVNNFSSHLLSESVVVYAPKMKGDKEFDSNNSYKTIRKNPYFLLWPRWLRMIWQIFFIIRREKIEKIYLHHVLPVGYIGIVIKKLLKVPFIVFLHGTDLEKAMENSFKRNSVAIYRKHRIAGGVFESQPRVFSRRIK